MNILFLHRSFPGQFKHLAAELAKDVNNKVVFITNSKNYEIEGVKKIIYEPEQAGTQYPAPYLKGYTSAVNHGQAAAKEAAKLKEKGFKPDIILGHSGWGPTLFMKDIFPDVPLICYFEWFFNAQGADTGFGSEEIQDIQRFGLRCSNSQVLIDLFSCDAGITPTNWQKSRFPEEFHNKISVIPDGIDTEFFKPDKNARFQGFTAKDEVITYGTRGMEPYRGFPQFMEAVEILLKKRPNAHVIIAGEDKVFYRGKLEKGTYKELMLEKLDLDMNRVHFVGALSYAEYLKMLQISSVHVYLTVPYVLSWSVLEAMSTECCIVASNTPPVLEVIKDNYNGLVADFFDINQIVEKVKYALDNQGKMFEIRQNARQTIVEKYELKNALQQQMNLGSTDKFVKYS
ncbi:MAG: glycosyltransferase [Candidatus Gastranaerophilales bacterium]|nr:glycosyltransferase [Candidatus Gastranaerophilales bacterium]